MARTHRRGPIVAMLAVCLLLAPLGQPGGSARAGSRMITQAAGFDCATTTGDAATPTGAGATPDTGVAASPAPAITAADLFPAGGGELTIFAAASLTGAFGEMETALEGAVEGLEVTLNLAGSQALATQLAEGAEADVFASANQTQMTVAVEAGRIVGEPVPFVSNFLTIVVPADNPAGVTGPADLGRDGLSVVLALPEVPVGGYSREAVCLMAQDEATHGPDFAARVAANVVSEEEDVRDVLTRVALGEADAGIVYRSDAAGNADVTEILIPDGVNVRATYPIAAVEGGDQDLAAAFIAYVLGADGQATLGAYGFGPPA
ncbi:MAG: molybdate ABC transporter substrate-binding protein [Chloroflexota bacterium]|nr:molybdate ABC transporter substrate-binding protein [Chloroflexota bacterium]